MQKDRAGLTRWNNISHYSCICSKFGLQFGITPKETNLSLIKSISGIRGTIGGKAGYNLTPPDIVACTAAYASFLEQTGAERRIVIGRDARISGAMVSQLVIQTLVAKGFDVVDLGLSTTPTVEMAVPALRAGAGIIITASHNPREWNALKFLDQQGDFISADTGRKLLQIIADGDISYASVDDLGSVTTDDRMLRHHIDHILAHPYVDAEAVRARAFHVAIDPVNSTGSIAVPALLEALGCSFVMINDDLSGHFAHNPEPLPEHLQDLCRLVLTEKADLGISVDPDVDRLALVCEDGAMFGEEYTLVAVADHFLSYGAGNTVSNLSSTRALKDITQKYGGQYYASAVGEVNVVEMMKAKNAVIGGEGNGGVIVPGLHYGRDALAGIAFVLTTLAKRGLTMTALRKSYPGYTIIKQKIELSEKTPTAELLDHIARSFAGEEVNTTDGVKIDFAEGWVHIRQSNTEPILRLYAEASDPGTADALCEKVKTVADQFLSLKTR